MSTLFFLLLMVLPEFFTRVLLSVPSTGGVRMDPKQWLLCKLSPADILGGPGKEPREVRKLIEEISGQRTLPNTSEVETIDHSFLVKEQSIIIREYFTSSSLQSDKGLLYFHGGGWVVCSLETHDQLCKFLCSHLKCKIFSVDYRLSPEHKYPLPLEDCFQAWNWICKNSSDLRLNSSKISVGGDSAGGHLATTLCHKLLDEEYPVLPFSQLLICPVIHPFSDSSSYREFSEDFYLTARAMNWFSESYIPSEIDNEDFCIWPLKAKKWKGFPPVFMISAGFDVLSDEAKEYAQKLEDKEVKVSHTIYKDCIHDFPMFSYLSKPKKYSQEFLEKFKSF